MCGSIEILRTREKIELLDPLTCVVGKNQAGKSALLRALHKFNPHHPAPYDMRSEWPRGQRTKRNKKQVVCEVRFTLSPKDLEKLGEIARQELRGKHVRRHEGLRGKPLRFSSQKIRRSSRTQCIQIRSRLSARRCQSRALRSATTFGRRQMSAPWRPSGTQVRGASRKLGQARGRHVAALKKQLTKGDIEPQWSNENQFIEEYATELRTVRAKLVVTRTQYQKAKEYIVSRLPTFIYMDDYKRFQGRANLGGLQQRLNNETLGLSEEDETFLMILKLRQS